jgi:competence protein ComEC
MLTDPATTRNNVTSFQRRRPLFWLVLFLCCGIALDRWLAPGLQTLGGVFLASLTASTAFLFLPHTHKNRYVPWLFGIALAIAGGMLLHSLRWRIPPADDISRRTSATPSFVFLRGTIFETSRPKDPEQMVWNIDVTALGAGPEQFTSASGRVQLRVSETSGQTPVLNNFGEGDTLELLARVEAPPEITLPDSFDYAGYLENQGIRRTGVASIGSIRRVSGPVWSHPALALRRFSTALVSRIEDSLPNASTAQSGLLSALLFGRRDRVDASDRESFSINGTAHLLAIAGWHLQFLIFLFWKGLGWSGLSRRKAAWLVIVTVCAFCALTGAAVPVVRATIMTVLYLLAPALGREADPLNVLAAAAFGILAFNPAELFTVGFQLSFLAVLALATIYPGLEDAWAAWRLSRDPLKSSAYSDPGALPWAVRLREKLSTYCRRTILVSLAAWLGTAPAIAWHMGRFSTLSLAVNLLAVPLGGLCMILGLITLAAGALSATAGMAIGFLAFGSIELLQAVNTFFASAPVASIDLPAPAIPVLIVYAAILAWAWIERGRAATLLRLTLLLPVCLLVLNAGLLFRESAPAPRITILDLTRGRAALIEAPGGGAALIDSGGAGQGPRIAETLRRAGITRLNLLVLTADESDAMGGASDLLRRIPVARVIFPRCSSASIERRDLERVLNQRSVPYAQADTREMLRGPGDVLWEFSDDGALPDEPAAKESALCLRVSVPGTRMLFVTARSNAALERLIAKDPAALEADIVRLTPFGNTHWPAEISQLIAKSHCRTIIAGSSRAPDEIPGFDVAAWASTHDLRLLIPHQDGSIRIQADVNAKAENLVQAFRGGEWKSIE